LTANRSKVAAQRGFLVVALNITICPSRTSTDQHFIISDMTHYTINCFVKKLNMQLVITIPLKLYGGNAFVTVVFFLLATYENE